MSSQRYISDTLKEKKKKVKKIKVYGVFLIVILFLVGLLYLIQLPQIQISEVKVSGNAFISSKELQDKANEVLDAHILWIIPKSNIFIFSKKELEIKLKQNPAIVSVKIRKDFFKTLTIEIQEQEKEMIYCTTLERTECFYINKTGFIYARVNEYIIPEQEILIYTEQGVKKIQDTILDEKTYIDVVLFVKNTARQDIRIGDVYIKLDGVVEFVTREKVRIITSLFDDFKKDFANLVALFEKSVLTKEQMPQIEYIDLRFGNKVFYKNRTN
jgi:hypothetical protein